MPQPDQSLILDGVNKLIQDELRYDKVNLADEHQRLISSFTDEQKGVYDEIMKSISVDNGGVFFLYGYGGTGKTFIWRALSAAIRSKADIVLTVASSGNASLLIPGGRTAHSRFKIPLQVNEDSTCNISSGSELSELICKTKLIIWDEAPIMNKYCFEALDRSLRDILRCTNPDSLDKPFGVLPLTRNMRIQQGTSENERKEAKDFSEWVLSIGDGTIGDDNDGEAEIQIPDELLVMDNELDPIPAIVNSIYPSLLENQFSPNYFEERGILAPTHEEVDQVNAYVLSFLPGEEKVYLSSDNICKTDTSLDGDESIYTSDYLNSLRCSGVPNHSLKLKVGVPVMLLRNIDQSSGLCNGTRLITTQLGNHIIQARIISGNNIGHTVLIPRMLMTPSDTTYPFKFQ